MHLGAMVFVKRKEGLSSEGKRETLQSGDVQSLSLTPELLKAPGMGRDGCGQSLSQLRLGEPSPVWMLQLF